MNRAVIPFIRETVANLFVAGLYFYSAFNFYDDFQRTERLTSALFVIFLLHLAIFAVIRCKPTSVTTNPIEWLVAILGTSALALVVPAGTASLPVGVALQSVGMIITFLGLISLNLSFGILPANRGIKTGGMYRFVRHPLYAGYFLSDLGILINQYSLHNLTIIAVAVSFQILRIRFEEAFLRNDPAYVQYCTQTRYRILPRVW